MRWLTFLVYLILNIIWCVLFYRIAPVQSSQLMVLIFSGSFFYTIFWVVAILLLKFRSAKSHRLALLLPILIAIMGYFGMDRPTAMFFSGLLAASEISLLILVLTFKK